MLAAGGLAVGAEGCSLTNIPHDACDTDAACQEAFGVGSACDAGYCTAAGTCDTGHDCRKKYGGGACVDGSCRMFVPENPQCALVDPDDLLARPLVGDGSTLVVGAIFATDDPKNEATADAVRLAIREIDESTGMVAGQRVGLVVCDNGGPGNAASGEERTQLDQQALDFLAGTLGVPYIVGPRTSSDALKIVARLVEKQYPTVVISPSATSTELTGVPSRLDPGDPYPMFWRTCPSDAIQGEVMAQNVLGADPGIATVSVVYTNDAYGQGMSDVILGSFGASGTELVPFDASKLTDPAAVGAVADTVVTQATDAVVIVAVSANDTVRLLSAMVEKGLGTKKFFFTDGSKDAKALLDAGLSAEVKAVIAAAKGTAPASARDEATFKQFSAGLGAAFPGIQPNLYSFLAHSYDAAYMGAAATIFAQTESAEYDGRDVAAGLASLSKGALVELGPISWPMAKQTITDDRQMDVLGISGDLNLDPDLGEGPAPIEVWVVNAAGTGFDTEALF
ncbi:MAG: hypothetical protein R3F14_04690 [Polyangiaceae bacterium]